VPSSRIAEIEEALDTFEPGPNLPALLQLRLLTGELNHRLHGGSDSVEASRDLARYVAALGYAESLSLETLDLVSISKIHAVLLGRPNPSTWRTMSVGARFNRPGSRLWLIGATPEDVAPRLEEMQRRISENVSLTRFERIALLHLELVKTHPFEDGNGRLVRLLAAALIKREFRSHIYLGITRIMKGDFIRYNAGIRSQREDAYARWIRYFGGAMLAELHAAGRFNAALQNLSDDDQRWVSGFAAERLAEARNGLVRALPEQTEMSRDAARFLGTLL
jgi:Fic family protein